MACALFDCWTFCLLETVTDSVVTQEFRERGISVCTTSSENVSTTNAKLLLESHCFSEQTSNTLNTFRCGFLWEFGEQVSLQGI